jgi:hypothetical protein
MPTIWGSLEQVGDDLHGNRWVQVRTILPGEVAIHVRAFVGNKTTVARGINRADLSSLKEGEFVEVTYQQGHRGLMEAETVYVHPDEDAPSQRAKDRTYAGPLEAH